MNKPIQSSSLLINEDPLQVLPTLAEKIGLNEAIVLQQVHFWLRKSKNIINDRKWTYDTYEEWQEKNFRFWSVKTVQRVFLSLESQKLLISIQPEKRDRRKWYTIDYELLEKLAAEVAQHHTHGLSAEESNPPLEPPIAGQSDSTQEDDLSLSDGTTCPDARGQLDLLEEDRLSPPRGQPDPMYIKVSENSSENSGELTHTGSAPSSAANDNGHSKGVCACPTPHRSKICDEERIRIASNMAGVHLPDRYAMTSEARRGTYDSIFFKRQKGLKKQGADNKLEPERDATLCPDCHGQGRFYPGGDTPEGRKKGVQICDHRKLDEVLKRVEEEYKENREALAAK